VVTFGPAIHGAAMRIIMILPVPVLFLAAPSVAQQSSEQDAQKAGHSVLDAWNNATLQKDAAGKAALYTELDSGRSEASRREQLNRGPRIRRGRFDSSHLSLVVAEEGSISRNLTARRAHRFQSGTTGVAKSSDWIGRSNFESDTAALRVADYSDPLRIDDGEFR
jgi:hypothetical protein